jgi:2-hydroxychromene-2-carboxylate isomerase
MSVKIEYWISVASPWTWLGSARFIALAEEAGANVEVLPMELADVFAATGGKPFAERPAARKSYRQLELARWSKRLDIPLNLEPRFYPVDRLPASCLLIAAQQAKQNPLPLSHAVLRAIWVEDQNIADWATLQSVANECGLDGASLVSAAQTPAIASQYRLNTSRAIASEVFGAPTFIIDGERFWGQDRLDFLAEKLGAVSHGS